MQVIEFKIEAALAQRKCQLRRADKSGARFALIVGEAELTAGKISLKPLREDQPQRLATVEEIERELATVAAGFGRTSRTGASIER